jgi:hypothetical protein
VLFVRPIIPRRMHSNFAGCRWTSPWKEAVKNDPPRFSDPTVQRSSYIHVKMGLFQMGEVLFIFADFEGWLLYNSFKMRGFYSKSCYWVIPNPESRNPRKPKMRHYFIHFLQMRNAYSR